MIEKYLFIFDIIGTVAFALSGASEAIIKKMDIFGVNILAITTAVGGGMVRDILIGKIPPSTFLHPEFTIISSVCASCLFFITYFRKDNMSHIRSFKKIIIVLDTLGLAAFTIDGVIIGIDQETESAVFFPVFLGVLTGVGGGIIRDLFANKLPSIFVEKIYAVAAIIGASCTALVWPIFGEDKAILLGFFAIILIRFISVYFRLNLPKIK